MLQHRINILTSLTLAVTAAACSTDADSPAESGRCMTFTAATTESRAITDTDADLQKAPFAVWADRAFTSGGRAPELILNAEPVTYTSGSWSYANTQYWYPGMSYSFTAMHPAPDSGTEYDVSTHTLSVAGFDAAKGTDLLAATFSHDCRAGATNPVVAFKFAHLLSQLIFVAEVDPSVGNSVTITSASITDVPSRGDWSGSGFNPSADNLGTWTSAATPVTFTGIDANSPLTIDNGKEASLFTGEKALLMIPQAVPSNTVFKIEYYYGTDSENKKPYSVNLSTGATLRRWAAGQAYRYRLTIGAADNIIFDKPSVVEWNDEEGGNFIVQ